MKAIILAAGSGTRLKKYTHDLPKGMLEFMGKTLIERQLESYRNSGIYDISIVTGYAADKIKYKDVRYFHSKDFETTNMLETLWSAKPRLSGDMIVSYADIVFEDDVLDITKRDDSEIGVVVDVDWRDYWNIRHGSTNHDIESLSFTDDGKRIKELGKPLKEDKGIDGRYVGIIKFSSEGTGNMVELYSKARKDNWNKPWKSSDVFQKAYMTDLLQAMIDDGYDVNPIKIKRGWLEFDTNQDYEKMTELAKKGELESIFRLV